MPKKIAMFDSDFISKWKNLIPKELPDPSKLSGSKFFNPRGFTVDRAALPAFCMSQMLQQGYTLDEAMDMDRFEDERKQIMSDTLRMLVQNDQETLARFFRNSYNTINMLMEDIEKNALDDLQGDLRETENGSRFLALKGILFEIYQEKSHIERSLMALTDIEADEFQEVKPLTERIDTHARLVSKITRFNEYVVKLDPIFQMRDASQEMIDQYESDFVQALAANIQSNMAMDLLKQGAAGVENRTDMLCGPEDLVTADIVGPVVIPQIKDLASNLFSQAVAKPGFTNWFHKKLWKGEIGKLITVTFDEENTPTVTHFPTIEELQEAYLQEENSIYENNAKDGLKIIKRSELFKKEAEDISHSEYLHQYPYAFYGPKFGLETEKNDFFGNVKEILSRVHNISEYTIPEGFQYTEQEVGLMAFLNMHSLTEENKHVIHSLVMQLQHTPIQPIDPALPQEEQTRLRNEQEKTFRKMENSYDESEMRMWNYSCERTGGSGDQVMVAAIAQGRQSIVSMLEEVKNGQKDHLYQQVGSGITSMVHFLFGKCVTRIGSTNFAHRYMICKDVLNMLENHQELKEAIVGHSLSEDDYKTLQLGKTYSDMYERYAQAVTRINDYYKALENPDLAPLSDNNDLSESLAVVRAFNHVADRIDRERYPIEEAVLSQAVMNLVAGGANEHQEEYGLNLTAETRRVKYSNASLVTTEKTLLEKGFDHWVDQYKQLDEIKNCSLYPTREQLNEVAITSNPDFYGKTDLFDFTKQVEEGKATLKEAAAQLPEVKRILRLSLLYNDAAFEGFDQKYQTVMSYLSKAEAKDVNGFTQGFNQEQKTQCVNAIGELVTEATSLLHQIAPEGTEKKTANTGTEKELSGVQQFLNGINQAAEQMNKELSSTIAVDAFLKDNLKAQADLFAKQGASFYGIGDFGSKYSYLQLADMLRDLSQNAKRLADHPKEQGYTNEYMTDMLSYQKRIQYADKLLKQCESTEANLPRTSEEERRTHTERAKALKTMKAKLSEIGKAVDHSIEKNCGYQLEKAERVSKLLENPSLMAHAQIMDYVENVDSEVRADETAPQYKAFEKQSKDNVRMLLLAERVRLEKQMLSQTKDANPTEYAKKVQSPVFIDLIASGENGLKLALGKLEEMHIVNDLSVDAEHLRGLVRGNANEQLDQLLLTGMERALEQNNPQAQGANAAQVGMN